MAKQKAKHGPIFLDTSILIARMVHSPHAKARIKARLAEHEQTETSLVVRQEFKRRLLREAEYLLRQLRRCGAYDEVRHHLTRLPPQAFRKRNICDQMLAQVHGEEDADRTERLNLYLRSLLVTGLRRSAFRPADRYPPPGVRLRLRTGGYRREKSA